MKIAILIPDLGAGGVEGVRLLLAHEFARRGHSVEFVLMQARGELLAKTLAHFSVRSLDCTRIRQVPTRLLPYLRDSRPDVMLVAMWPLTGVACLVARFAGVGTRVVVSEHNDFRMTPAIKRYERWLMRHFGGWIYSAAHGVIAVSEGVSEGVCNVTGLRTSDVDVIYNPIRAFAPSKLEDADHRLLAGWFTSGVRLIAIGSLKPQKGFDTLLYALAAIRTYSNFDAGLLILGEGGLRGDLEQLIVQLGLDGHVWLPGFRENPAVFLQNADVFILSSRWEGLGNVVIEALSAGVPVVATDCRSGPAEILEHGRYGTLVPVGDVKALADAILESFGKTHDGDALRRRSADFSVEKAAAEYLAVMK